MSVIMISYRESQQDNANRIKEKAEALGFTVWLYKDNKPFGKTVVGNYSNAIEQANFVFVLLSEDYWESSHTQQDRSYAVEKGELESAA